MNRSLLRRAGHPLATKHGRVRRSRLVLYEAIGPDPAECWNCHRTLDWFAPSNSGAYLVVDHINEDTMDDHIDNLRASCRNCNVNRSKGRICTLCGNRFSASWGGQKNHTLVDRKRGLCR